MAGRLAAPVLAGSAVGIAFVLLFSFLPQYAGQHHERIILSALMNGTDTHQIYIVNDDGTDLTRLTGDSSLWYFEPVSSPDGSKIAYVIWNSFPNSPTGGNRVLSLNIMNIDGTNRLQLASSHDDSIGRYV